MLRYKPPKSSIWGHKLRKMQPQREARLFQQFLDKAVGEYKFAIGSLSISDSSDSLVQHFEHLLATTACNGFFPKLTEVQCQKCKDHIIKTATPETLGKLLLLESYAISKWRVNGHDVATNSRMVLYYGQLPCISTFLRFNTREEFQLIKTVLSDLGLCKLNEKHLSEIKQRK